MRDTYRTVGALSGLAIGMTSMWLFGFGGLIPAAIFGAGGAVIGGMSGERIHDRGER